MSICNVSGSLAEAPRDEVRRRVLDAARDCVLAYGMRRTSLSDVARRAGVSRPTLYRRWPEKSTLVADLMTREWVAVMERAGPEPGVYPTVRAELVAHVVAAVAALRAHPLFTKIVEVDPELLQPYVLDRLGTSQRLVLEFIEERLRAGQADGSVRAGDPARLGRLVLLTVQSVVLSARIVADRLAESDLAEELALLLDRYLRPEYG